VCASEVLRTEQSNEQTVQQPWYIFTIPFSSNYVSAGLNVLLEVMIILAVSEMFRRLESRQLSNLLRNGVDVRIQESTIPVVGEGLLVRNGLARRATVRFLVLFAIFVAEFSASGRTETYTVIQEALLVGGDVTIFDLPGNGNRTTDYSWPFAFDTEAEGPVTAAFSANYTNGPAGLLKEAEASCTSYYQGDIGLRQVALSGIFIESQLRIKNFKCIGDELVRVTDNALLGGQCGLVEIPFGTWNTGEERSFPWYGEGVATRGGIDQNITVFTASVEYYDCVGDLRDGIYDTVIGINHQPVGGGGETGWFITRVDKTYFVTTFSGGFDEENDYISGKRVTRQIQVQSKLEIVHLLVKAMIDTGVTLTPDYLDAVSEAWYTNRGSAGGMTNAILRDSGPKIELLGETGTILNQTDRLDASFPSETTRAVTDVDIRFLVPLFCIVLIYVASLPFSKGEFRINYLNYVSARYHDELSGSSVGERTAFAVVGFAAAKDTVQLVGTEVNADHDPNECTSLDSLHSLSQSEDGKSADIQSCATV